MAPIPFPEDNEAKKPKRKKKSVKKQLCAAFDALKYQII